MKSTLRQKFTEKQKAKTSQLISIVCVGSDDRGEPPKRSKKKLKNKKMQRF